MHIDNQSNFQGILMLGDVFLNDKAPEYRDSDPYLEEVIGKLNELFTYCSQNNLLPVITGELTVKKFNVIVFDKLVEFFMDKKVILIESPRRDLDDYTTAKILSKVIPNVVLIGDKILQINISGKEFLFNFYHTPKEHLITLNNEETIVELSYEESNQANNHLCPIGRYYEPLSGITPYALEITIDGLRKQYVSAKTIEVEKKIAELNHNKTGISEFAKVMSSIKASKKNDWSTLIEEVCNEQLLSGAQKESINDLYLKSLEECNKFY